MSVVTKKFVAVAFGVTIAAAYALPIPAQDTARPVSASTTIQTHLLRGSGGDDVLVVVDASRPAIATYRINQKNGFLTLSSVRQIGPDLTIDNYNSEGPTPQDIRNGFGK